MDEIFGEENFLAELIWDLGTGTAAGHFTRAHEYIIVYAKDKNDLPNFIYEGENDLISERAVKKISKGNPPSKITFPKGMKFEGEDAIFTNEIGNSEKIKIIGGKMVFKNGKLSEDVTLEAGWAMRNQILAWLNGEDTYDSKGQKVERFFFDKKGVLQYEKVRGFINPQSIIRKIGSTRKGTSEIEELFGFKVIDYPKPIELLKLMIKYVTNFKESNFVLDFFAGSGTTAQAVMELNKEDGGNRKFILVQLPEPTEPESEAYKAGYKTIADIAKERIRRAAKKIQQELDEEKKKREGEIQFESKEENKIDLGFKVFKLDESNFKQWRPFVAENEEQVKQEVLNIVENIKPDAIIENILHELVLKNGKKLTDKIEKKNGYYIINDNELVLLLETVDNSIVDEVLKLKPQKVIALDKLFNGNDQLKTNTVLQFKDAGVEFKSV